MTHTLLIPEFYWLAVIALTVLASARITRLLVVDKFPPIVAVRNAFADWTENPDKPRRLGWQLLMFCGYCMSFWVTAAIFAWGYLAGVYAYGPPETTASLVWMITTAVFSFAYLAALIVALDPGNGDD